MTFNDGLRFAISLLASFGSDKKVSELKPLMLINFCLQNFYEFTIANGLCLSNWYTVFDSLLANRHV